MKKLLILALLPIIFGCKNQNQELQNEVQDQIAEIEHIIKLNSVKISAIPTAEKDLEKSLDAFKDKKNYNPSFFDSLKIQTTNRYPNSYFTIDYEEYKLSALLGYSNFYFGDNPERKPKFEIQKLIYAQGQTEDPKTALMNNDEALKAPYFDKDELKSMVQSGVYFFQKNSRPIIGAEVKLITNFAIAKDYPLETNQKNVKTSLGNIEIVEVKGNEVTYKYPATLANKIEVNALYKNGKFLASKGSQTFKTNLEIKQLEQMINALKNAKDKIASSKIKTENEVKAYLKTQIKESDLKSDEYVTHSEYFASTIDKVIFSIIEADKPVEKMHTYYISKLWMDRYKETGYEICLDAKTSKKGIVDQYGKWLVKPNYYDLSQHNYVKNYIQVALTKKEGANTDYWLDKKNQTLVKPNYELNSYSLQGYHPKLIVVEKENQENQKLGVANIETGKLIIPLEYSQVSFEKGKIFCEAQDRKTTIVFDEAGKKIRVEQSK